MWSVRCAVCGVFCPTEPTRLDVQGAERESVHAVEGRYTLTLGEKRRGKRENHDDSSLVGEQRG